MKKLNIAILMLSMLLGAGLLPSENVYSQTNRGIHLSWMKTFGSLGKESVLRTVTHPHIQSPNEVYLFGYLEDDNGIGPILYDTFSPILMRLSLEGDSLFSELWDGVGTTERIWAGGHNRGNISNGNKWRRVWIGEGKFSVPGDSVAGTLSLSIRKAHGDGNSGAFAFPIFDAVGYSTEINIPLGDKFITTGKQSVSGIDYLMLLLHDPEGGFSSTNGLWAKTHFFGTPSAGKHSIGYSVRTTSDGGYIATGVTNGTSTNNAMLIVKFDSSGEVDWYKIVKAAFGESEFNSRASGQSVIELSGGGFVVAGSNKGKSSGEPPLSRITRFNSSGAQLWDKFLRNHLFSGDSALAIIETSFGELVIIGTTEASVQDSTGDQSGNVLVIRMDLSGNVISSREYGSLSENEIGISAYELETTPGNVIIGGSSEEISTGDIDALAARFDFYLCGDSDGDGAINVADATYIVNLVFNGGPLPIPTIESGDANGDCSTNIADATYIIALIFNGGPAPLCCPNNI